MNALPPVTPAETAKRSPPATGSRLPADDDRTWYSSSFDLARGLIVQEWSETQPAGLSGAP